MSDGFDPYYKWLGIPPAEQPPNHYRLLAIPPFESDREVIRNAADLRKAYLKSLPAGQHGALLNKLLDEVSTARVCLLNADQKQPYDRQLQTVLPGAWAYHLQACANRQPDSDGFDPYHKWLGIPPDRQPADHYQLLGLVAFESDREVIQNAADGRMAYLKTFGTGRHSDLSQELLNELAAARVCLLTAKKKRAYDEQLQAAVADKYSDSFQADLSTAQPVIEVDLPKPPPARQAADPSSPTVPVQEEEVEEVAPELAELFRQTQEGQQTSPPRESLAPSKRPGRLRPVLYVVVAVVLACLACVLVAWLNPNGTSKCPVLMAIPGRHVNAGDELRIPLRVENPEPWNDRLEFEVRTGLGEIHENSEFVWQPSEEDAGEEYLITIGVVANGDDALSDETTFLVEVDEVYRPRIWPGGLDKMLVAHTIEKLKEKHKEIAESGTAEDKLRLVRELLYRADKLNDSERASKFAHLKLASMLAFDASDFSTALKACEKIGESFPDVDALDLKTELILKGADGERSEKDNESLAEISLRIGFGCLAIDKYLQATRLAGIAIPTAEKCGRSDLVYQARFLENETSRAKPLWRRAKEFTRILAQQPENAKGKFEVGKFLCFAKNEWQLGLAMLVNGDDENLKGVAKRDSTGPTNSAGQIKLGDAWWDVSDKVNRSEMISCRQRAKYWYLLTFAR